MFLSFLSALRIILAFEWNMLSFVISAECQSAHFEASQWSSRIGESLGLAAVHTPVALLKDHKFEGPPCGDARGSSNVPQWIGDLMKHCLPLLKCSVHGLQFAAYHLLAK